MSLVKCKHAIVYLIDLQLILFWPQLFNMLSYPCSTFIQLLSPEDLVNACRLLEQLQLPVRWVLKVIHLLHYMQAQYNIGNAGLTPHTNKHRHWL